ncbi:MAG: hypothetical protein ABI581_06030 [Sediminibacterium sp.]
MKRATQLMAVVIGVLIATTSCKKNAYEYTPGIPAEKTTLTKIEKDGEITEAVYNSDGSIQSLKKKFTNNPALLNYVFSYENGKLKEINFGGKWKYYYTGENITSVETYNANGVLKYRTDFSYANGRVSEKIQSIVSASGVFPDSKTIYHYRADGNVSKKEIFQDLNNAWFKEEDVIIEEYDQYINASERFETYPYLPAGMFSPNNPVKEIWIDRDGSTVNQTAYHVYTYDVNARPLTRKTTYKFSGYPDTFSDLKIEY